MKRRRLATPCGAWLAIASVICGAGAAGAAAEQESVAAFYADRQVTFVIGSAGGGGYDFYSRLIARYMPRHLPGHPLFVMQNMPGAAGVLAADYLYNQAPRDGSEIGMVGRAVGTLPLLDPKNPGPKYDATKFNWIGTPQQEIGLILAREPSPIQDLEDLRAHELVVSGTSQDSPPSFYPKLLNALVGAKFHVIEGYKSSQDALLALDRGEVNGHVSGSSAAPLRAQIAPALRSGRLRVIAQVGLTKDPAYAQAPLVMDLAKTSFERQALQLVLLQQAMAWPMVAPPGVPAARVAALRAAFEATMADRDFLAAAASEKLGIDPLGGAEIEALIARAYAAPKPVVQAVQSIAETP
jgi:tripartite-type tricarboxylate transporter receptor subunit TctC